VGQSAARFRPGGKALKAHARPSPVKAVILVTLYPIFMIGDPTRKRPIGDLC
jgi:hypothetical protein